MKEYMRTITELFPFIFLMLLILFFILFENNEEIMTLFNYIFLGYVLYIYAVLIEIFKNVNVGKLQKYTYIILITAFATALLISRDSNNKLRGRIEQANISYDIHLQMHQCDDINCAEANKYEEEIEKNELNEVDDYYDY